MQKDSERQENWNMIYGILLAAHIVVILLFIWFTNYFS